MSDSEMTHPVSGIWYLKPKSPIQSIKELLEEPNELNEHKETYDY